MEVLAPIEILSCPYNQTTTPMGQSSSPLANTMWRNKTPTVSSTSPSLEGKPLKSCVSFVVHIDKREITLTGLIFQISFEIIKLRIFLSSYGEIDMIKLSHYMHWSFLLKNLCFEICSGGVYGQLRVYYSTIQLLVDSSIDPLTYFDPPINGTRGVIGQVFSTVSSFNPVKVSFPSMLTILWKYFNSWRPIGWIWRFSKGCFYM